MEQQKKNRHCTAEKA